MKTRLAVAAAALLALSPAIALAQTTAPAPTTGSSPAGTMQRSQGTMPAAGKPSKATMNFVHKAAITDMFEIKAGQLAQQKSQNTDVKQFGQQMVEDHTKISAELKSAAASSGVKVPTTLDQEHQKLLTKLQGESGTKFDQAYVAAQRTGHKQAVALFTSYSKNGQNADLKQFAQKTLPTLKHHLQMAEDLRVGKKSGS